MPSRFACEKSLRCSPGVSRIKTHLLLRSLGGLGGLPPLFFISRPTIVIDTLKHSVCQGIFACRVSGAQTKPPVPGTPTQTGHSVPCEYRESGLPNTIRGYYKAEEHNRVAFTADGFYRTGDMVRLHPSGNLVVEGRKKDLINRGGEKISAEEVEYLMLGHERVHMAAMVAMPDPVMGERGCAFVVPRPSCTLTLQELTGFLLEKKIAKFKLPERLEIVESLPLTGVGKVSKKQLREQIAAKLKAEEDQRSRES